VWLFLAELIRGAADVVAFLKQLVGQLPQDLALPKETVRTVDDRAV
jgi:hypothetical protein